MQPPVVPSWATVHQAGTGPTRVRLRPSWSKTAAYRWANTLVTPLVPLLRLMRLTPVLMTSTAQFGQVALHLARHGYVRHVLENRDIVTVVAQAEIHG
ncbi:hypothetical protein [Streptomyces sp. NPDC002913]